MDTKMVIHIKPFIIRPPGVSTNDLQPGFFFQSLSVSLLNYKYKEIRTRINLQFNLAILTSPKKFDPRMINVADLTRKRGISKQPIYRHFQFSLTSEAYCFLRKIEKVLPQLRNGTTYGEESLVLEDVFFLIALTKPLIIFKRPNVNINVELCSP